jgi:predicted DNA-binding protein
VKACVTAWEKSVLDIGDIDDYYLAADVAKRVRNGEERVFSAQEVREDLGLEEVPPPLSP